MTVIDTPPDVTTTTACVYRIYDAQNRLLYIGSTHDLHSRLSEHRSPWTSCAGAPGWRFWWLYDHHTATEYPTLPMARAAERQAIVAERPTSNIQGNPSFVALPERTPDLILAAALQTYLDELADG